MDVDEALRVVGGYRRYHLTIFILLGISMFIPVAWQGLSIVFIAWEPPHWCQLDDASTNNISAHIPIVREDNGNVGLSKCTKYVNSSIDYNITTCTNQWTYDNNGYYTVVEQWNLVCQRNYLSELSQTAYHLGCLFSEIVFSYLVDRYGRKMVHSVSNLAICVVGIANAFSNTFITFIVLRTILGMLTVACLNSGLTEIMELFDSKRRAVAGISLEFQWIFCYLTLPILTYYITDWRILQIALSVVSAIFIVYFWILPESPIWLVAAGRYDDAEKLLHQIARWNGVPVDPNTQLLSRPESSLPLKPSADYAFSEHNVETASDNLVTDLVPPAIPVQPRSTTSESAAGKKKTMSVPLANLIKDKYLRLYLVICSLLWLANCFVYYALILSTPTLAGNRFINFLIMGFVELPAVFLALYTTQKFGRRIPTCVYHIIAGVPVTIVTFIPKTSASGTDLSALIVTLVMISKFAISASFSVVILYAKELFPTNLRGTSSGVCQVLGRIGAILAPMAAYATKTSYYWLPNIVFGFVSIGVGLLTLILPETSGHPLPQTLEDVHRMATGSRGHTNDAKSNSIRKGEEEAVEQQNNKGQLNNNSYIAGTGMVDTR